MDMNETGDKLKSVFGKTMASLNTKTSTFVETTKLKSQISSLQGDIKKIAHDLGVQTYKMFLEDTFDMDMVKEKCTEMKTKHDEIDSIKAEIDRLEQEEDKKLNAIHSDDKSAVACAGCGATLESSAKFCTECGKRVGETNV